MPIGYLPSKPEAYRSVESLFSEIRSHLAGASSSPEQADLLTAFCFASFFSDCLQVSPCLLLYGSSTVPVMALLRTLACFCRHAILSASIYPMTFAGGMRPTLLVCQADAKVERLLPSLQFTDVVTSLDGRLCQLGGATAIHVGEQELNSKFTETCLKIHVDPSDGAIASGPDPVTIDRIQNQLLMYRLCNYDSVKASGHRATDFSAATQVVARSLVPSLMDPALQALVTRQLKPQDDAARCERTVHLSALAVETLLVCCHEGKREVHVDEVAKGMDALRTRQGDMPPLQPRRVGHILRMLGFPTMRLDISGRGIHLFEPNAKRIHELASRYGVPSSKIPLAACPHCQPRKAAD